VFASRSFQYAKDPNAWEALLLTGVNSRHLVLGRWWAIFRQFWFYHVLTTPLKLGIIYGLYQNFYAVQLWQSLTPAFLFFNYLSHHLEFWGGVSRYGEDISTWTLPVIYKIFSQTGMVLILFSLLDIGFVSALSTFSSFVYPRKMAYQISLSVLLRGIPIGIAVLFLFFVRPIDTRHPSPWYPDIDKWSIFQKYNYDLAADTLHVAGSTHIDGGIASINLTMSGYSNYHILRQYMGLTLGAALYIALTWLTLWAAQKIAIRRGALPPPEW
jgi:hypothetical protein